MTDVCPLDDRVLVRRLRAPITSIIVLTDAPQSDVMEVLAVGPGKLTKRGRRRALQVVVGDVVIVPGAAKSFPDYEEGEEILICEADIAGIVTSDGAN